MPARKKSIDEWVANYTADGTAVANGLDQAFKANKLGATVLPRLSIMGTTASKEAYEQTTSRRCSDATVQDSIIANVKKSLNAAGRSISEASVVYAKYMLPIASYGVAYDDEASWARFVSDIPAYARWRAAVPGAVPLPPPSVDENESVQGEGTSALHNRTGHQAEPLGTASGASASASASAAMPPPPPQAETRQAERCRADHTACRGNRALLVSCVACSHAASSTRSDSDGCGRTRGWAQTRQPSERSGGMNTSTVHCIPGFAELY